MKSYIPVDEHEPYAVEMLDKNKKEYCNQLLFMSTLLLILLVIIDYETLKLQVTGLH